ncbi:MAG TPA: hypothetical protein VKX17_08965 [Planctomycetota bacterium]|nr:hypothetical protein [Planctomycetota bacterium]
MPVTGPHYPLEEIARRGNDIYFNEIRPKLKGRHKGKFISIDIETGEYEIDRNSGAATHRLRARLPDAEILVRKIGYRAAGRMGGSMHPEER